MADYMNANIAGVTVPGSIIDRLRETPKEDRKEVAIEIAADLVRRMKGLCQGVHLMPLGWDDIVAPIVEAAELGSTG